MNWIFDGAQLYQKVLETAIISDVKNIPNQFIVGPTGTSERDSYGSAPVDCERRGERVN